MLELDERSLDLLVKPTAVLVKLFVREAQCFQRAFDDLMGVLVAPDSMACAINLSCSGRRGYASTTYDRISLTTRAGNWSVRRSCKPLRP